MTYGNISDKPNAIEAGSILSGMRVADFTSFMAGPYCARWLSDLGAEVIKIEPVEGEWMRGMAPLKDEASMFFGQMNAGKKSIALDLRDEAGRNVAKKIVLQSDIVIEAFRPGVMRKFGLDAESIRAQKPELIYCSISGFGQNSEKSQWPAYASIIHASSGLEIAMATYRGQADEPPRDCGVHFSDMLTSLFSSAAIQIALVKKLRFNQGSTLDVNLMDATMSLMVHEILSAQLPPSEEAGPKPPMRALDGYITVSPHNDRHVMAMLEAMGHSDLSRSQEYTQGVPYRNASLLALVEDWVKDKPADLCERLLMEASVPAAAYRSVRDAMSERQFSERGTFAEISHGSVEYKVANLPISIDGRKPIVKSHVAEIGEHTTYILQELLSMNEEEVKALRAAGAIRP